MKSVALIGLPFDHNSSFLRGAAKAPAEIREAFHSDSSNSWSETGIDLSEPGRIVDAGDAASFDAIPAAVEALLRKGHRVIGLGGDHSVTFPVMQAYHRIHSRLSILHVDAHPDLYHDFDGNPHSHASPFARILESGLAERLVQIGIRTLNRHLAEQADRFGVEIVQMKDWRDDIVFEFETPLYITVDLDGLDPSCAPGVSHHEPGGLTTRQLLRVIHTVKADIVGADVVELNPDRDLHGMTAMVAARLIKEIAGRIHSSE